MAVAMFCSEMHPYQTHSSPLEAAEAGTQTVGHSPQGCRLFRVTPADAASRSKPCSFQRLSFNPPVLMGPTVAHEIREVPSQYEL